MPKTKKFTELIASLGLDETDHIKPKHYKFDRVKENTFPESGFNLMMDTMTLPTTKEGYQFLLVVVDLWSDNIDFEPLKSTKAKEALAGFQKIIERPYIKMPEASIRTDDGVEFKKEFHKFLKNQNIAHRVSLPYRHKQNANVESANNALGRILVTYLSNKEKEIGETYREWTQFLPQVRIAMNNYRKKPEGDPYTLTAIPYNEKTPKYKIGDLVEAKYEKPHDVLGKKEEVARWRQGDVRWNNKETRKVEKVLNYPNNNRYILKDLPNVAYAEEEIRLAKNNVFETRLVNKIIGHYIKNKKKYYVLWYKKQLKKDAVKNWEGYPANELTELQDEIREYNASLKK